MPLTESRVKPALSIAEWAKTMGVSYRTAWRMVKTNRLPPEARAVKLTTGTIRIYSPETGPKEEPDEDAAVIYARINPKQRKEELLKQVDLCRTFCAAKGWRITETVREVAPGVGKNRKKLLRLIENPPPRLVVLTATVLSRYDFDVLAMLLNGKGCSVITIDNSEENGGKGGALEDIVDAIALTCHRHFGQKIGSILVDSLKLIVAKHSPK